MGLKKGLRGTATKPSSLCGNRRGGASDNGAEGECKMGERTTIKTPYHGANEINSSRGLEKKLIEENLKNADEKGGFGARAPVANKGDVK